MSKIIDYFEERLKAGDLSTEELRAITGRMERLQEGVGNYTYLDSMVSNGYLSPDEAKSLQEPLQELPQGKRLLIACYVQYSKAIDYNKALTGDYLNKIRASIQARDFTGKKEDESIADFLGEDRAIELYKEWQDALVASVTEVVSSFVLEKRRRIRVELKKAILVRIANALSLEPVENEETGEPIDSIPYLREMAKENGYRENAKSLNEQDRKALSLCADYYLDLLEVLSLNGVEDARTERNKGLYDEEGNLKETFYYEDIADEALMEFADVYDFQSTLYALALNATLSNKIKFHYSDFAKIINSKYASPEDLVIGRLLNTKFREYALALYEDEQLREKLSPATLEKWERFLEEQGLTGSTDEAPATPVKKASSKAKKATPKKSTTKAKNTKSK